MKNCDKRNNLVISRFNIVPCISRVQYCSLYLQGSILFLVSPGFNIVPYIARFNIVPYIARFNIVPCISRVQYFSLYLQGSILFLVSPGFNIVPCIFRVQYCSSCVQWSFSYLQGSVFSIFYISYIIANPLYLQYSAPCWNNLSLTNWTICRENHS